MVVSTSAWEVCINDSDVVVRVMGFISEENYVLIRTREKTYAMGHFFWPDVGHYPILWVDSMAGVGHFHQSTWCGYSVCPL